MKVLKRRHLAKAITWRICATTITILITIIVTGNVKIGLIVGPIDVVIKLVLYYIHERCWLRTKFGINANQSHVEY